MTGIQSLSMSESGWPKALNEALSVEDHLHDRMLILFRYDLKHRVAPCDPAKQLTFDTNGKWSAILPIY